MAETLDCALAGRCGGCPWIRTPISQQRAQKAAAFAALWAEAGLEPIAPPELLDCGTAHIRQRADLTLRDGRLGMYALGGSRELVDMEACPMMDPRLEQLLTRLRAALPDVPRASLRLRVAPGGARGLWLDLPNIDIKGLLDEQTWLTTGCPAEQVEIGQKRRRVVRAGDRLKFTKAAALHAWMRTPVGEGMQPLYGLVGGFSQPGEDTVRVLVGAVLAQAAEIGASRWLELFSGAGTLTLPLAHAVDHVEAWEVERTSTAGLERAAQEAGLSERITVRPLNVYRVSDRLVAALRAARPEAILADPPRSGLGAFVGALEALPEPPRHLLYVSCFAESLIADAVALAKLGYRAEAVVGVDQFPHTPHGEWVVRFHWAGSS